MSCERRRTPASGRAYAKPTPPPDTLRDPVPLGTPVPAHVPLPSPVVDATRLRLEHEMEALEGALWLIKDCLTPQCCYRMIRKALDNRRTRLATLPKGLLP